ncbi:hypothetical protein AVI51_05510 [Piscirickettsia salmonis]|uniref:Uncharacterized protein n=1 Tax=Piscirickettsia salmonis TaxID=1238 RepID=A0A9Q5YJL5_PISSA|nr:hypothetical protein [Piscirickettsia salmonis]RNC78983.1 hypothetical protein DA717_01625 [Piscirickettsiaceae bacterium NZ-RLO2]ALA25543.1 lipoprotein [Piscirickettsia salmonis]APS43052.1 hypothetical protein AVI48_00730 [Piscirickettsia salmonis]APS46400.1 hypothetical protein AVI49_01325 [Piscirickettsia salmonis]APS50369.1 hypothetical protein AVI50_05575 [Piscirickettsia salmonis]
MRYLKLLISVSVILAGLLLTGCAQMMQAWVAQNCTTDAAYSQGLNAARHGEDMKMSYAAGCPANQSQLNAAYRQGYQYQLSNQPAEVNININTHKGKTQASKPYRCHKQFGQKVCGYDCKSFAGQWTCAQKPDQECIQNMSDIKCGYHCNKGDFGQLTCLDKP